MPPKKKRNANDNEDVEPARQRPAQISNHVATVYYTRPLKEDVLAIRYGRREHDVFRCCNIKLREPSVSGQLFAPGKMVVSGAKSEAESVCAVWACCRALSSFNGHRILPVNFQTDNIVAFGSVGFALDLPKFYSENSASTEPPESLKDVQVDPRKQLTNRKRQLKRGKTYAEYTPADFRGLQYYPKHPLNVNMFPSGTYVATGGRKEEHILKAINCVRWDAYKLKTGVSYAQLERRMTTLAQARRFNIITSNEFWRHYDRVVKKCIAKEGSV